MNQLVVRKQKNKMVKGRSLGQELVSHFVGAAGDYTVDMLAKAVRGIASAYRAAPKGAAGRQEMRAAVAPLANSLSIGSTKGPRFTNVSGGLALEHVEPLTVTDGRISLVVSSESFMWLRPIAAGFEEFRIKTEFCWVPTCPATTTGRVMLAYDYDPLDSGGYTAEDAVDYFNTQDHCISSVWAPAAISPAQSKWLLTGTNGDVRLFSPGRFQAAGPELSTAGFFLVKYKVEFRKPQPQALTGYIQRGVYSSAHGLFLGGITSSGPDAFDLVGEQLIQRVPGSYLVVWCTDAPLTGFTADSGTVVPFIKSLSVPNYFIMWHSNSVGNKLSGSVAPAPAGPTSYKLSIVQTRESFSLP